MYMVPASLKYGSLAHIETPFGSSLHVNNAVQTQMPPQLI